MLISMEWGTVADMLAAHGYGPGRASLRDEFERRGARKD
jgi:hypothetical protein